MADTKRASAESIELSERLKSLEQIHRATFNILEDYEQNETRLKKTERATINLLEDFNEERTKFQLFQKATLNLLEDVRVERDKSTETHRALVNMLEDFEEERVELERAKILLETANKELEAFSYSVSHDLQSPLRAISGFAQVVMEDYAPRLDDEGKRCLWTIQENAQKMGQLISDLLTFSRLSRQQMLEEKINIGLMAENVLEELAAQEVGRNIKFTVHSVPPAYGDRAMIRQVLVNLFSNAIKFTKARAQAFIEFGCLPEPENAAYYVKDNGVGFDMQYYDKLFNVFQRLHAVQEFEGTGVGLALVSRIISRHAGRVWAESKLEQGATFYFQLPERKAK